MNYANFALFLALVSRAATQTIAVDDGDSDLTPRELTLRLRLELCENNWRQQKWNDSFTFIFCLEDPASLISEIEVQGAHCKMLRTEDMESGSGVLGRMYRVGTVPYE